MSFSLEPSSNGGARLPAPKGPYDIRLGYSSIPAFVSRLEESREYRLEAVAAPSAELRRMSALGLSPVYREKTQTGLRILDRDGRAVYAAHHPERVYLSFDQVPPLVVQTLLRIEDRNLLDRRHPYRNPGVEWPRFTRAGTLYTASLVSPERRRIGASTLATQLEKMRHSPHGVTSSAREKLRQMATASLRAYLDGPITLDRRRQIVVDYVNSLPLAAAPGYGEVIGLLEGLKVWYDADVDRWNTLLVADEHTLSADDMAARAQAYRQVLSLLLALRRPSWYLVRDRPGLEQLTDQYLRLLVAEGVISGPLANLALEARPMLRTGSVEMPRVSFVARKGANAVRAPLAKKLGLAGMYDLDRLDLTVESTLDLPTQEEVTKALGRLAERPYAAQAGFRGARLLESGDPGRVIYSFTLYERGEGANLLRVQADSYDRPLNVSESTQLELGSTAKLRTLVTYLEVVAELHARYANLSKSELRHRRREAEDRLTAGAIDYLLQTADRSLEAMLAAALERRYSASPNEIFYTGGAPHTFVNFDEDDNRRIMTVREAFQRSVNLPFIRLMRDIVDYHVSRQTARWRAMLSDANDARRQEYLRRFAEWEGGVFLRKFYPRFSGLTTDERLARLAGSVRKNASSLMAAYRFVNGRADAAAAAAWVRRHAPSKGAVRSSFDESYQRYAPDQLSLADRAYVAGVHPLELWLAGYLGEHPAADLAEVYAQSTATRQEAYEWLFRTSSKSAQDLRIRTVLHAEAFGEIHRRWSQLGYPFESLVPSYATAIGSSADNPAALAELMGIIMSDGVRHPAVRITKLHFAKGTPYEHVLARRPAAGRRVLEPAVAQIVRQELVGVVQHGTARRAAGAFDLGKGAQITVGGKTGTGDNRMFASALDRSGGRSEVMNRTAAFVFLIGDRFYGVATAYVSGEAAAEYRFTSALAVQLFRHLALVVQPLVLGTTNQPPDSSGDSPGLDVD
jgi:membrane peptidoglycan carboxypeptidase